MDKAAKHPLRSFFSHKRPLWQWLLLTAVGAVFLIVFLSQILRLPLAQEFLATRFVSLMENRLGGAYGLNVQRLSVRRGEDGVVLFVRGVEILDRNTGSWFSSPAAEVKVDGLSLLNFQTKVRSVTLVGPTLTVRAPLAASTQQATPVAPNAGDAPKPQEADQKAAVPPPEKLLTELIVRLEQSAKSFGIEKIGIRNGTVVLEGANLNRGRRYEEFRLDFFRQDNGAGLKAEARSDLGLSQLSLTAQSSGESGAIGDAMAQNIALDDILVALQIDLGTFSLGGIASGRAQLRAEKGALVSFQSQIDLAKPYLVLGVEEFDRLNFDRAEISMFWREGDGALTLAPSRIIAEDGHAVMSGRFYFENGFDQLHVELNIRDALIKGAKPSDPSAIIESMRIDGVAIASQDRFMLHTAEIKGPAIQAAGSGEFLLEKGAIGARAGLALKKTSAQALMRVWPRFLSPQTRAAVERIVQKGFVDEATLAVNIPPALVLKQREGEALPAEAVDLKASMRAATLFLQSSMPLVEDVSCQITATARAVNLQKFRGQMSNPQGKLQISEASIQFADLADEAPVFRFRGGLNGEVSTLQSIAKLDKSQPDTEGIKGKIDGQVDLAVGINAKSGDIVQETLRAALVGRLQSLSVDLPQGLGKLEARQIPITVDEAGTRLQGQVSVDGQNANLLWLLPPNRREPDVTLTINSTDVWRKAKFSSLPEGISGLIPLKIMQSMDGDKLRTRFEADLKNARLDHPIPGLKKDADAAGLLKANLNVQDNGEMIAEEFSLETADASIKGQLRINAKGELTQAQISQYRVPGAQNINLSLERAGSDRRRLRLSGESFDARPLIEQLFKSPPPSSRQATPVDYDLNVKSLIGFNSEVISDFKANIAQRGAIIERIKISGRIGRGEIDATTGRDEAGQSTHQITASDAGAFLRFTNIYRRVSGGDIEIVIETRPPPRAGRIALREFVVRGEPALRSAGGEQSAIQFTKMKADFLQDQSTMKLRDAVVWGPQTGVTFEGVLDTERDLLDISGTLVPAYALNNLLAQIPIVGAVLGGSNNEGVLGVTFRATGSFKAPQLQVNPLSAVAPGFLRKFFEFGRAENIAPQRPDAPTTKPQAPAPQ